MFFFRYSIRGAIWFQGEHNVVTDNSQASYACIFKTMINAWRDSWTGIGDFPFIYAQVVSCVDPPELTFSRADITRSLAQLPSLIRT